MTHLLCPFEKKKKKRPPHFGEFKSSVEFAWSTWWGCKSGDGRGEGGRIEIRDGIPRIWYDWELKGVSTLAAMVGRRRFRLVNIARWELIGRKGRVGIEGGWVWRKGGLLYNPFDVSCIHCKGYGI